MVKVASYLGVEPWALEEHEDWYVWGLMAMQAEIEASNSTVEKAGQA